MEFLAGVFDLYAFVAISRRWLAWFLAVSMGLGMVSIALDLLGAWRAGL
jgi:hypothetical protein